MSKKGKPRKTAAKQKIRKSDSVIVITKNPIEQIIGQTAAAKELASAVKRISKKEKPTLDRKVKEIKPEKLKPEPRDIYGRMPGELSPYSSKVAYKSGYNVKENSELFQWSEYREGVAKTQEIIQRDELGNHEIMMEKDLMQYLSDFMLNKFIGQDMNDISVEQKEKMNYYVMFNQPWVMMKVNLLGYGEKRYGASIPKPASVIDENKKNEVNENDTNT